MEDLMIVMVWSRSDFTVSRLGKLASAGNKEINYHPKRAPQQQG